jgi:transposase
LDLLDTEPLILKDEIIVIKYTEDIEGVAVKRTLELRRITYYSQKHTTTFIYWTNNLELTATEIVEIYQNRWQIEKFFKRLKQNFPLNYFLGDNENAIQIRIWCALIGLLLLQVLHKENTATIAFSILAAIVSIHLMNYTSITSIINHYKKKRARKPEKSIVTKPKPKADPKIQTQFGF